EYQPRPERRVNLSGDQYDGTNSEEARRTSDFTIRALRFELAALTSLGNEISLAYRYSDGEYPNRVSSPLFPIDNSYRQHDAELGPSWRAPTRYQIDVRGGYGWRRYADVPQRNVQGLSWQLQATWQATGKTSFEVASARDFGAVEDFDSLYAITERSSV